MQAQRLTFVLVVMMSVSLVSCWKRLKGGPRMKSISVDQGGVWGVSEHDVLYRIHYLEGNQWSKKTGGSESVLMMGATEGCSQADVGRDSVWCVTSAGDVYVTTDIAKATPGFSSWQSVDGSLQHVSVSSKGHVWAVANNTAVFRQDAGLSGSVLGTHWVSVDGLQLKQVSVGEAGVWGVDDDGNVFYRQGTNGDNSTMGTAWIQVDGQRTYVSSGKDTVLAVNENNVVYRRAGITPASPQGTGWDRIRGRLQVVDAVDDSSYWGVDKNGKVYHGDLSDVKKWSDTNEDVVDAEVGVVVNEDTTDGDLYTLRFRFNGDYLPF